MQASHVSARTELARAEAIPKIENAELGVFCAAIAIHLETASVVRLHKPQSAWANRRACLADDVQTDRIWIAKLSAAGIGLWIRELIVRAIEGFPAEVAVANRLEAHIRGNAASGRAAIECLVAASRILVANRGVTRIAGHAAASRDSAIAGGRRAGAVTIAGAPYRARITIVTIGIDSLARSLDALDATAGAFGRIGHASMIDATPAGTCATIAGIATPTLSNARVSRAAPRRVAFAAKRRAVWSGAAFVVAASCRTAALVLVRGAAFVVDRAENIGPRAAELFAVADTGTTGVVATFAIGGRSRGDRGVVTAGRTRPRVALRQAGGTGADSIDGRLVARAFDGGRRRRRPSGRFGCAGRCQDATQPEQTFEDTPAARAAREGFGQRIEP